MKKINRNLAVNICSLVLVCSAIIIGFNFNSSDSEKNEKESSIDEVVETGLNKKEIKFKNNGDTFVLSATVNQDATIKSVRFISDRSDCISITRKTENSVILKRIKEFTGVVKITAISEDPFSDFKAECYVRCYNAFKYFLDSCSTFVVNDAPLKYLDTDTVFLAKGKITRFALNLETAFSIYEDSQPEGTYTQIEDDDFVNLKNQIVEMFSPNRVYNITQEENGDGNTIFFDIDYQTEIIENSSVVKNISLENEELNLTLKKYVPVGDIEMSTSDVIVL